MVLLIIAITLAAAIALGLLFCGGTDVHFHRKPKKGQIKVACVGDSITYGAAIPGCFRNSYPARLGRMLGSAYHTENFGLNDRTLQNTGAKPYRQEGEYRASLNFAPDIIVIMLGSNDTKPVSWISKEHFMAEYRTMLDGYIDSCENAEIILCTPPWGATPKNALQKITNDIDSSKLSTIAGAVLEIAAEYRLPAANLYDIFKEHNELLGFDGLHPNKKGAELIAQKVWEILAVSR